MMRYAPSLIAVTQFERCRACVPVVFAPALRKDRLDGEQQTSLLLRA